MDSDHQSISVSCKGAQFGLSLADFEVICTLGTGTFGKVLLVRLRHRPSQYYAMKVLAKVEVVRLKQVEHMNSEKDLLALVSAGVGHHPGPNPFCVTLVCTFQDERNLYMMLEFVQGGELFSHLRRAGRFTADVARFFAANVLLALQGLHELDIVYRDLKPENILLGPNVSHLGDYDLSFDGLDSPDRSNVFFLSKPSLHVGICQAHRFWICEKGTRSYLDPLWHTRVSRT